MKRYLLSVFVTTTVVMGAIVVTDIFVGCVNDPVTHEQYDPRFVDEACTGFDVDGAQKAAEYSTKCVEAGGRGVRSTEDWIAECHRSAEKMFCRRELVVHYELGWTKPCRLAAGESLKMCKAAGFDTSHR